MYAIRSYYAACVARDFEHRGVHLLHGRGGLGGAIALALRALGGGAGHALELTGGIDQFLDQLLKHACGLEHAFTAGLLGLTTSFLGLLHAAAGAFGLEVGLARLGVGLGSYNFV